MSLESSDGTAISFDQLKGSKIVVYFYEGGG
jgi:peroxiredoxin